MRRVAFVLLASLAPPCTAMGAASQADIEGAWKCGPYKMNGAGFEVEAVDLPTYSPDGKYVELGTATYIQSDGSTVRFKTNLAGNWKLKDDVIEIIITSGKFVSSDSPRLSVPQGQASLDAQIKERNWRKILVLSFGETLTTVPLEAKYKEAEVQISCSKA